MLGHAFILVGNGDSSCNVRDYGSYAGGETWCAVYINSNANIAETNGLVCVSSLDIYAFIGNHAVANVCTEVIVPAIADKSVELSAAKAVADIVQTIARERIIDKDFFM